MRSIAFIWAIAVNSAALAQGAGAQEKIQLAQSSTVINCMMNCNAQVTKLPNHLSRARAGDAPSQPQQQSRPPRLESS